MNHQVLCHSFFIRSTSNLKKSGDKLFIDSAPLLNAQVRIGRRIAVHQPASAVINMNHLDTYLSTASIDGV